MQCSPLGQWRRAEVLSVRPASEGGRRRAGNDQGSQEPPDRTEYLSALVPRGTEYVAAHGSCHAENLGLSEPEGLRLLRGAATLERWMRVLLVLVCEGTL